MKKKRKAKIAGRAHDIHSRKSVKEKETVYSNADPEKISLQDLEKCPGLLNFLPGLLEDSWRVLQTLRAAAFEVSGKTLRKIAGHS